MRLRTLIGLGVMALTLATTAPLMAQQPTTTVYRASTPTGTVLVEQPAPAPRRHLFRLRLGLDATGGAFAHGPQLAFGGLRARVGIELGDFFALYYQPTGLVGAFIHSQEGENAVAGLMWNSFLAELTLFDMVQVAAGPSVDFVWGCTDAVQSRTSCTDHGAFFGIDGRVAIVIGHDMMGSRGGLTLSADVHPTWYSDHNVGLAVLGGVGLDMY